MAVRKRQHIDRVPKLFAVAIILLALFASGVQASEQLSYAEYVSAALAALEKGKTQESVDALQLALACNSNDPLAHTALGLTLLMGGYPKDAEAEFAVALKNDANCAEAVYGKGLAALSRGELGPATSLFCQAQAENSNLDIKGTIEYVKTLGGAVISANPDEKQDECLQALNARALMNGKYFAEASPIWTKLQALAARPSFGERIGCSMTFSKSSPIVVTGWRLKKAFRSVSPDDSRIPAVSGKVVLKADLKNAQNVSLVSFYVDNKLLGITNHDPFSFTWDTTAAANGPHTVKVVGVNSDCITISEKTMHVLVRNKSRQIASQRDTSEGAAKAWQRMWALMRLKPSASCINYNLAQCALRQHDNAAAQIALERVLAADPNYTPAADQLAELYRKESSYARLQRVPASSKVVALSFDDGPKDATPKLLDLLEEKGVKATFFVVGKQVEAYPDILRRMAGEGHDIENHTYLHRDLEKLSSSEITQEIFQNCSVVRSVIGKRTRFLRPPGGHEGVRLPDVMRKFSMGTVFWTINCGGEEGTTKQRMVKRVVGSVSPGAIILMHNVEPVTLLALPEIIDTLKSRGYTFVTLSDACHTGS